jgi:hypothetical protein
LFDVVVLLPEEDDSFGKVAAFQVSLGAMEEGQLSRAESAAGWMLLANAVVPVALIGGAK